MDPGEEHLATDFLFGSVERSREAPAPRVRGVRLDRMIGEGAFGVVWQGEQFDPVVRPVAVKILRMGALGTASLKRFELEKLALARLEHPHIARILDAGNTADGAPYLVMEFVDGVSLDRWCARHRGDLTTQIRMFVRIARAIGYAHRQGILHRDLKPANVLVRGAAVDATSDRMSGTAGEEPKFEEPKFEEPKFEEPKVIDFGVAKLVGFDSLRTETRHGPAAATPAYMSPEIALGAPDVDGRVDVWSLGVMLYECLAGVRPFQTDREGPGGALDLQRQITEGKVRPPSAALAPEAPRGVRAALEDELDWIVMRALERVPSRRYTTPDELADDLERWLMGANVRARPATTAYRIRKLARRHRAALAIAGTIVAGLTIAVAGLGYGYIESARQAQRWKEIASVNRAILTGLDPWVARGLDTRLLELVLEEVELDLTSRSRDPVVEAQVRFVLGLAHASTGGFDEALRHYGVSRARWIESGAKPDGSELRELDNAIGHALLGSGQADAAVEPLERAAAGSDLVAANALHNLAAVARVRGDLPRAESLLRDALNRKRGIIDAPSSSILETEQELALLLALEGRLAEAEVLTRRLFAEKREKLGERHPGTLRAANNLAEVLLVLGQAEEAGAILASTIPSMGEVLGMTHEDTLSARNNLAQSFVARGSVAEAVGLYREIRDAFVERDGLDGERSILAAANLAQGLALIGSAEEAEREFKATADRAIRSLGPSHLYTLANDVNYAGFLAEQARWAEALVVIERASSLVERNLGRDHQQAVAARTTLARARLGLGQASRALEALDGVERLGASPAGLTPIERRSVEVALMAAEGVGDTERAARLADILAKTRRGSM